MQYLRLPINFESPRKEDYLHFAAEVDTIKKSEVWVHYAANLMVAAQCTAIPTSELVSGSETGRAVASLQTISKPRGKWKIFVSSVKSSVESPNQR